MKTKVGLAGKVARVFIRSKLTLLIVVASILLGLGAVVMLPREEEPQIIVPMIDVFVQMPGASAKEVEERVTKPMEKLLWEVPGVEYIYSTSSPGMAMAVARFYVGQNEEDAIVRLNQKMLANFDLIPPGASQPLVKPRSIDDVPILALTLSSDRYDHFTLRRVAAQVHDQIKEINDVSEVKVIGGVRRQIRVLLDEALMAAHNVAPAAIVPTLERSNRQSQSGGFSSGNREFLVETGAFLHSAEEVGAVVIGVFNDRPVYLRDVAKIEDGPEEPADYVMLGLGDVATRRLGDRASEHEPGNPQSAIRNPQSVQPAVTISVAKRKGVNAIEIADKVLEKVERTAAAHDDRHLFRGGVDLADARIARIGYRRDCDSCDAGAHTRGLLFLRLHAQPDHALRAHLFHRHSGGRRHRRRRKHRASLPSARKQRPLGPRRRRRGG